jgi:hypothetical protein
MLKNGIQILKAKKIIHEILSEKKRLPEMFRTASKSI